MNVGFIKQINQNHPGLPKSKPHQPSTSDSTSWSDITNITRLDSTQDVEGYREFVPTKALGLVTQPTMKGT